VGQYPATLVKGAPKILLTSSSECMRQKTCAYEAVPNNTSPDVNWELLSLSGLNCTVWVNVTPNVPVMEM
jgi:hypothetical protein